jgi:hypothetical protein
LQILNSLVAIPEPRTKPDVDTKFVQCTNQHIGQWYRQPAEPFLLGGKPDLVKDWMTKPLDLGATGPLSRLDQGLLAPIRVSLLSRFVRNLAAAPDIGPVGTLGRGWLSNISAAVPELTNSNHEEERK